ncbi:neuropeptide FF receptor 1-like isoform X1 [Xenia sp. Carnegie-2017]|uniref:neuropeptide FF receptor 1-like isoform X1 n=1 Tax=Xenia sp. Carnegie-2017 TaxID=2897299 RepID=UPI001F03987E|nr:neuropeptide FF receptor 1-like isoform X1 [Xenia sp. Carnegie-2017]XP_046852581.1 neuropeptide FF receptor 1-like isoform X1 [Xenia sp. Carnegie-2017]XP_046852582.1 neuropeptide FF receptor 1-like isoform X1 [Xenia sp. Carnegie-2017]XP_046852583.1 neuropeptide FF receptor 1-like isoform X1 [Xenia sp. Carnegie-2017]XP_046852584.1 neuropeptide FF receptor 1-like isoform X1 [Xenia sp. Carnegie-2017]XP_046852585.1 neuropeptide FF receptor 1-like isoform X1 [Xenia sp. Carnegie-2017]
MIGETLASNNSNHNNTDDFVPLGDREWFIILKYSIFCIIFLISLFGNILVCFVVCRRMKVKNVTNNFLMNLAISDLLYTFTVPFDVYETVKKTWPYGEVVCRFFWPSQTIAITVSAFTLTALSVTRFWAVVKPLRQQLKMKQSILVIAMLWTLAICTVVPYVHFLRYKPIQKTCEEEWPVFKHRQMYTLSLLLIQYAIPLTIISTCYLKIGFELTRGQTNTTNRSLARARSKEARRVIKMLVILTLAFAILTLPSAIMWMWNDFGGAGEKYSHFYDVLGVLYILDFLSCASNPIIYSFCNESFSREFRRQVGCIIPGLSPNLSSETGKVSMMTSSASNNRNTRESLLVSADINQNSTTKV